MKKFTFTGLFAMLAIAALISCTGGEAMKENTESKSPSAANAVIENIMTRTSIRQFTDRPVSKDTLDLLVKAGMAAPSAVNAQPWAFVVITEKPVLDSLNVVKPWFNLKTATAAIVVCGDLNKVKDEEVKDYWVQDCSAVTENILLAAHAYGLGAVWCGVYPKAETVEGVTRILGLPENVIPLNVITLGYPDENPEPKDKFKEENVHFQHW